MSTGDLPNERRATQSHGAPSLESTKTPQTVELMWVVGRSSTALRDSATKAACLDGFTSRGWVIHTFSDSLRAREAMLIGVRPNVLVCESTGVDDETLDFIQRVKLSSDRRLSELPVLLIHAEDGQFDEAYLERARAMGIVDRFSGSERYIDLQADLHQRFAQTEQLPTISPIEAAVTQPISDTAAVTWLNSVHGEKANGLLMLGQLHFHGKDNQPAPKRPLRIALLKQQLRAGDDLMADDNGRFWLTLRTDDELQAIRIALRLSLALTRSADPSRFAVGIVLSGAYLGDDPASAVTICEKTLPVIEPNGQLAVAVDRWKFTIPLRVAQVLI